MKRPDAKRLGSLRISWRTFAGARAVEAHGWERRRRGLRCLPPHLSGPCLTPRRVAETLLDLPGRGDREGGSRRYGEDRRRSRDGRTGIVNREESLGD